MPRVWVVGSANMDLVYRVERFPAPGETVLGATFTTSPGGKGANQAAAVGRLGGEAHFVGRVGADAFGEELKRSLAQASVDVSCCLTDASEPTGTAMIMVDATGQNCIAVASGANGRLSPDDVSKAVRAGPEDIVLCQLETPLETVERALSLGRPVLNPAPARELSPHLYLGLFLITPNETEAAALTGLPVETSNDWERAARWFLERGVANVVITLGGRGSFWSDGHRSLHVPARQVSPVDTTAAGDCFNGALALALAEGYGFEEGLRWATAAAAIAVSRPGAQASLPSRAEVRALLGQA